jgi:hypothetical protein
LNICSKLVTNTSFSESFSGFSWLPTLVRPTLMVRGTERTHFLTYSCLIINLCFGPSYRLKTFGHWVFPHPIYAYIRSS